MNINNRVVVIYSQYKKETTCHYEIAQISGMGLVLPYVDLSHSVDIFCGGKLFFILHILFLEEIKV